MHQYEKKITIHTKKLANIRKQFFNVQESIELKKFVKWLNLEMHIAI